VREKMATKLQIVKELVGVDPGSLKLGSTYFVSFPHTGEVPVEVIYNGKVTTQLEVVHLFRFRGNSMLWVHCPPEKVKETIFTEKND